MNMKQLGAGLSIAVGVLATNAHAQATKPAAPPAAAPAAAPVTVTPAMRAAVKELLDLTKTRENLARTFQAMGQALPQQMAQAMNAKIEEAQLTPEQKQKVRESMNEPFANAVKEGTTVLADPKLVDQAVEKVYGVYAKHFTIDEVKQLVAFYKSPIGGKVITEMPQVVSETMQGGVVMFQPKLAAIVDKTVKSQIDSVTKK